MCKALKEVHSVHVIHGNLNSENIFLTTHKNIKIGDFGHSRSKLLMKYMVKFCAKKGNHLWGSFNAEGKLQVRRCVLFS